MKNFEKKWLLTSLILCIIIMSSVSWAKSWPVPKPSEITIATDKIGSTFHRRSALMAECILKKHGVKIKLTPIGTDMSAFMAVLTGSADAYVTGGGAYTASRGMNEFSNPKFGPQKLRYLYLCRRQSGFSPVTTKSSGIEQIKDLKGKRVAWIVGSGGINLYMKAYLAFANLTWEDVEIVKFPGYTPTIRGLMEGSVDAAMASSGGPISYELDSSPKGMKYIILPFSDKEGWKRIQKVYPLVDQTLCTTGAAIDPKKPVEIGTAAGPTWVTLDKLDEGKAYWITRLVAESYECAEHPDWWAPKASIGAARSAPFHPGSVKYFEETGIWSEQQKKIDQGFITHQKETSAAFEKAKAEAKKKGMDKTEFKSYWDSIRP